MKLGRIEKAGAEDEVLELAAEGKSTREIADALRAKGIKVSHTAVGRFLRAEAKDRELGRRVVNAERAHVVAGKAGETALDHLEELNAAMRVLCTMVQDGYHTVRVPGAEPVHVPLDPRDRIQAARYAHTIGAYMIDLAAGQPKTPDEKNLAAIRAAIAEVFGYGIPNDPNDPQEAPPTADEHTPPVLN